MCSSWNVRIYDSPFCGCYCFSTFRPIFQETLGYCFVLCDGKGSSERLEKIKKMLKVEKEVAKKPTSRGVPTRSPIQVLSRLDDD